MAIDYEAIAAAGGIGKGPSRYATKKRKALDELNEERAVYAAVTTRDSHSCRVCGRWCNPQALTLLERAHHHHLQYRSKGGPTTTANVCLLCPECHEDEHRGRIELSGNADFRDEVTHRLSGIMLKHPRESGMEVIAWV